MDNDATLNKKSTSYNDIFDSLRLELKFYHFEDNIESLKYNSILIHIFGHFWTVPVNMKNKSEELKNNMLTISSCC